MTAIIILNWNGADDTIACLQSLADAKGDFRVFVVDNGSADDSLSRISLWVEQNDKISVNILPLDKNYGFAKGNNKGIELAATYNPSSYLLLNNDTEVLPDFLVRLQEFSDSHPKYRVLTPKINYFYEKNRIWNCGGKLTFGFRKYFYVDSVDSDVKEKGHIDISFVTGCALFFYPELLDEQSHLFTERFFFGEEDFEFSIRMKKANISMACVLDSLIYHKVGASTGRLLSTSKIYLHYLNRFINIRLNFGILKYYFWVFLNIPLLLRHFYKSTQNILRTVKLVKCIIVDAQKKDSVTQDDFRRLMLERSYFKFKL